MPGRRHLEPVRGCWSRDGDSGCAGPWPSVWARMRARSRAPGLGATRGPSTEDTGLELSNRGRRGGRGCWLCLSCPPPQPGLPPPACSSAHGEARAVGGGEGRRSGMLRSVSGPRGSCWGRGCLSLSPRPFGASAAEGRGRVGNRCRRLTDAGVGIGGGARGKPSRHRSFLPRPGRWPLGTVAETPVPR